MSMISGRLRPHPSSFRLHPLCLLLSLTLLAGCTDLTPEEKQALIRKEDGPPPVAAGDPEERLADEGEAPITDEDDCGRDYEGPGDGHLDPLDAAGESEHSLEKIHFAVQFQDEVSPHRLMSASVMPGETMDIEPVLSNPGSVFAVGGDAGTFERLDAGRWRWTAPDEPGIYCVKVTDTTTDETMCINVFVLTPYDGSEIFNGYRIGRYPKELYKGLEAYRAPRGFIEVTEENQDTWVSPHFQLKQFLCKQAGGYPKYLVLSTRMLLKLERILEEVNSQGIPAESFFVMSGYRTPFYNASIGNETTFSRHAFGDAADIFIDRDRNGVMDDIDDDGQVTVSDAEVMLHLVEGMEGEPWYQPFIGGLGLYGPAPHRGPFIHVDTRGFAARW